MATSLAQSITPSTTFYRVLLWPTYVDRGKRRAANRLVNPQADIPALCEANTAPRAPRLSRSRVLRCTPPAVAPGADDGSVFSGEDDPKPASDQIPSQRELEAKIQCAATLLVWSTHRENAQRLAKVRSTMWLSFTKNSRAMSLSSTNQLQ